MILTDGMAHQRKLIRDAVVALLQGANTDALTRVKATNVEPIRRGQLPFISIYTLGETTDETSAETAPIILTRKLKLEIAAWVAHTDALPASDAMDQIAEQIEAAMASDYWLAGTCADQLLSSTELQVVEDDGKSDPLVGIIALTYDITYRTVPDTAATPDDFLTADATEQLVGGVSDTLNAEDTITVRTP